MSEHKANTTLIAKVKDTALIKDFYLEYDDQALLDKFNRLRFTMSDDKRIVPFNAQLREYKGAVDNEESRWIIKKVADEEVFISLLGQLAFFIDLNLQTLSAPTLLIKLDGDYYRASKVIKKATQISGYNYLEEPLRRELANDLINRWLMFDEDRNPNNYLIIHNSAQEALIVAIDYNHTDLYAQNMKITGKDDEFGWHREEKTRFLTLLKPSNFECYTIDDFSQRLELMRELTQKHLQDLAFIIFRGHMDDASSKAQVVASNLQKRSRYISDYFNKWFKDKSERRSQEKPRDYSGLGKTFVDFYKRKI